MNITHNTSAPIKTATLDLVRWVEILEIDSLRGFALVCDQEGEELEVSLDRLHDIDIDGCLDLGVLENN
mgnify:FL=1|jgi:hypothetical protein|tara:strand:- start:419 stop:625 length:207 start_codon:yes stop_codon:yes gene_type:complete